MFYFLFALLLDFCFNCSFWTDFISDRRCLTFQGICAQDIGSSIGIDFSIFEALQSAAFGDTASMRALVDSGSLIKPMAKFLLRNLISFRRHNHIKIPNSEAFKTMISILFQLAANPSKKNVFEALCKVQHARAVVIVEAVYGTEKVKEQHDVSALLRAAVETRVSPETSTVPSDQLMNGEITLDISNYSSFFGVDPAPGVWFFLWLSVFSVHVFLLCFVHVFLYSKRKSFGLHILFVG